MKHAIWILLVVMGITHVSAQEVYTSSGKSGYHKKTTKKKKGYDPDKLIIGGGINFDLGDGYFAVGASPIVGYRFTNNFEAGVGFGYQYYQIAVMDDPYHPGKYLYQKENLFYPSVWSRYFVWRGLYATGQFEFDFIRESAPVDNIGNYVRTITNYTNPCLLLGAGYRVPMGGRVSFFIEGLYDVLQGKNSPYPAGFPSTIRVGIAAGL